MSKIGAAKVFNSFPKTPLPFCFLLLTKYIYIYIYIYYIWVLASSSNLSNSIKIFYKKYIILGLYNFIPALLYIIIFSTFFLPSFTKP